MRRAVAAVLAGMLALAGCGGDDGSDSDPATSPATTEQTTQEPVPKPDRKPAGTTVKVSDSEFGSMLFGADDQAIYIFENDPKGKSACYGDCAAAWPPVYTKGEPQAGKGAKESLLGTVMRRDGRRQVTYAGQPLYFYAHEKPGEVRCHNVDLNGGLWWVIGPNGKRRP